MDSPKLIINRLRPDMVKRGDMMDIDDMIEILSVDLLGVVPEDEAIVISTNRGEPAVTDQGSKAGEAYRNIARRITGESVPLINLTVENGFVQKLKRLIGLKNN